MKHLKVLKVLSQKQIDIIQKMCARHCIRFLKNLQLCYFKDSIVVQLLEQDQVNLLMELNRPDLVKVVKKNLKPRFQINLKQNQRNKMMNIIWNKMKMKIFYNKIWIQIKKTVINMKYLRKIFQLLLSLICLQSVYLFKILYMSKKNTHWCSTWMKH